jgi:hypothetical protein
MLYKTGIVVSYLICGLVSVRIFYAQFNFYVPGLIFIAVTVVMTLISDPAIKPKSIAIYCVLSYILYFAVFFLTIQCGSLGIFTGIFLSGAGAYIVFWLTNKFLVPVNFKSDWIFWLGALSFLFNVILMLEPASQYIKPVYDIAHASIDLKYFDLNIRFAPVFLFWQLSIGTRLGLEILKNRTGTTSPMIS